METAGQWCDNASCPDCGKISADNIKMHSYAERRFRCTTCQRTFSADKGTLAFPVQRRNFVRQRALRLEARAHPVRQCSFLCETP
jgi:transposase-like protein